MNIWKCVGCGAEQHSPYDRPPKGARAYSDWEARRDIYPAICPACNGGIDNERVLVAEVEGRLQAFLFRLKPGCGERRGDYFDLWTHEPIELSDELSKLYGQFKPAFPRCQVLGHEADDAPELHQRCRHCGDPRFEGSGGGVVETRYTIGVAAVSYRKRW